MERDEEYATTVFSGAELYSMPDVRLRDIARIKGAKILKKKEEQISQILSFQTASKFKDVEKISFIPSSRGRTLTPTEPTRYIHLEKLVNDEFLDKEDKEFPGYAGFLCGRLLDSIKEAFKEYDCFDGRTLNFSKLQKILEKDAETNGELAVELDLAIHEIFGFSDSDETMDWIIGENISEKVLEAGIRDQQK